MSVIDFSQFVNDLADLSGRAILPFFRSALAAEDKAAGRGRPFDPVTEADRAGEAAMRRRIRAAFPSHGIVGEEFAPHAPDAEYVWVLDPIDGTRAFLAGLPLWGTLIGLTRGGRPAYGMMHQPFTGERFSGDGGAAFYRGPGAAEPRRLRTRRRAGLEEAILCTTSPRLFSEEERAGYERIEGAARLARYGTDCYGYCMVAAGHVDLVVEAGLQPYDIVALIPIVEGAGGVVTNWTGGSAAAGGRVIASGDPRLHEAALKLLAG